MKHLRLALVALTFLTVCGMLENRVQAQVFDGGFSYGWYPYWFGGPAYQSDLVPTPPYFAIHQPVYYGTRDGMPYGNSPIMATVQIAGLDKAIEPLRKACSW